MSNFTQRQSVHAFKTWKILQEQVHLIDDVCMSQGQSHQGRTHVTFGEQWTLCDTSLIVVSILSDQEIVPPFSFFLQIPQLSSKQERRLCLEFLVFWIFGHALYKPFTFSTSRMPYIGCCVCQMSIPSGEHHVITTHWKLSQVGYRKRSYIQVPSDTF